MTAFLIGAGFALALMLGLQMAIYRRLGRIPARTAEYVRLEIISRARADADALKEGTAKSVGEIVRSLNQHHDRAQRYQFELHETYRTELAALQARAREREANVNVLADVVGVLREVTSDLQALHDEGQRPTDVRAHPPPRTAVPPPPPTDDDSDLHARETVESPPPAVDDDEPEEEPTTVAPRSPAISGRAAKR